MKPPRILIAPGPYKECLSSYEVARFMKRGVEEFLPQASIAIQPLCDGGSGLTQVLVEATQGKIIRTRVSGPTGDPVESFFGVLGDGVTGVVESAAAAGLSLVPMSERNPLKTTTYGVGELMRRAVEAGCSKLIVGCGDSGTNDCGVGAASALGVKFLTSNPACVLERPSGQDLRAISSIDESQLLPQFQQGRIPITVACNLTSILCGSEGTSRVYGPQKGATLEQILELELGVRNFVDLVFSSRGIDLGFIPGAGGAGGLAASLYAFLGAKIVYSIEVVDQFLCLDEVLKNTDLVLTGEGCIDDRTATGKVACGIALKAKKHNCKVVAIVGRIAQDHEDIFYNGIDAAECISDGPLSLEDSIRSAGPLIQRATTRALRFMFMKEGSLERVTPWLL